MKQSNYKELAQLFKALAHPERLKLFQLIAAGFKTGESAKKKGCCPGIEKAFTAACNCMSLSRSTISHHMKVLQRAGLISCERRGQSYYCEVNQSALQSIQHFMK